MKSYFIMICAGLVVLISSCGIKGPPLPPIDEETVQKQKMAELRDESHSASGDSSLKKIKKIEKKKKK